MNNKEQKPWNTFLALVKERPDKSLKINKYKCPFCESKKITKSGSTTTLVGGRGDANHVWTSCSCQICKKSFIHEHINNNTWYTCEQKIIAGIPSCFENYIYTCAYCNGKIERHYLELDSDNEANFLSSREIDGVWKNEYRIVFKCNNCLESIESNIDHWYKGCENPPKISKNRTLLLDWKIYEEVGMCEYNPSVFKKLKGK